MKREIRFRRSVPALLLCALWSCSMPGCAAQQSDDDDTPEPQQTGASGNIGGISVREANSAPQEVPRVLVASFHFDDSGVHPREAVMTFGAGNVPRSDGTDYAFELLGAQDRPLARFTVIDPRRAVVEQEGLVRNPEGVYAARFPFRVEARAIRVLDGSGRELARTDMVPVIRQFCARMERDAQCLEVMRSLR